MNILDGLLLATDAQHAIELTLSPAFARRWPSFYQGLQDGRIDRSALRAVTCQYLPPPSPGTRLVLAVDATSILRPQARTARDRMAVHAANLPDGAPPVGIGWQFSAVVVVPDPPSSWTYVLDCTRIPTRLTPCRLAALQLASLRPRLPCRPVVVGDRYYGSAAFVRDLATVDADLLLRIQTHRVFYRAPPPRVPGRRGRPPTRGARFQPKDPTTHGPPTATWTGTDARGRPVTVTAWAGLAFADVPGQPVTVLRCARQDGPDTKREPRVIWLAWVSPDEEAPLAEVPDLYPRRFSIEHGFRFDKQALCWETLHVRTPEQFQRWTDLVMLGHNTLCLARDVGLAAHRPWERPTGRPVTPQQVRRAWPTIFAELGTPAAPSQPRGKSPGRAVGTVVRPATRYPVVRKGSAHAPRAPAAPP